MLSDLFVEETQNEELGRVPRTIYREAAAKIKELHSSASSNGTPVEGKLLTRQADTIIRLASRLLEVRVAKAQSLMVEGLDEGVLTPEERFALEPAIDMRRRIDRLKESLLRGQISHFEQVGKAVSNRNILVKFERSSPPIVGVDLARYGPFHPGDLALIPMENARPMLRQGAVKEIPLAETKSHGP